MKNIIIVIVLIISCIAVYFVLSTKDKLEYKSEELKNEQKEEDDNMTQTIKIIIKDQEFTVSLESSDTVTEFLKKLPLEITMNELNGNEKYYYFDNSLPNHATQIGRIEKGDIMLYGTNCLVLFYKTFSTSYSYTKIGKIEDPSSLEKVVGNENIKVKITK